MIKKLFAWSGNQCANPGCRNHLVDAKGTMIGRIAHIHAAKGGARYDPDMSVEKRRAIDNLILVCGLCHDRIDDPAREDEFPATLLGRWKRDHERLFKRAERDLVRRYEDKTALDEPTLPVSLAALALATGDEEMVGSCDHIESIAEFAGRLKSLPHDARDFALAIARRMRTLGRPQLSAADAMGALGVGTGKLKTLAGLLREHHLGDLEQGFDDTWKLKFNERRWGPDPFAEILLFCEATGVEPDRLLFDLDFALYDALD